MSAARSISLRDLAKAVLRGICSHRVMALLNAYFDETGTHDGSPATLVAGFVGMADAWSAVEGRWRAVLDQDGVPTFHYFDCRHQRKAYARLDRVRCDDHVAHLSEILGSADLYGVSAAFSVDWPTAVAPDQKVEGTLPARL